jgi:hypothetical protein
MEPHVSGKYGRDIVVTVGDKSVPLSLDAAGAAKRIDDELSGRPFQARGDRLE